MGLSVFPAPSAASKTRYVETLTSGTSWTVPAGVEYVNATLVGGGQGGQGGGSANNIGFNAVGQQGLGGQIISTTVTTTPGASIVYAIGAGGAGGAGGGSLTIGSAGGTTTFTGATSATGGDTTGRAGISAVNGGAGGLSTTAGATGGAGYIILEYWIA
jgi:hypothetical protein